MGKISTTGVRKSKRRALQQARLDGADLSKECNITTDASDFALGAILRQSEIEKDHACQYASRCLRGPELRYSTYDRELFAIVFLKEQYRPFLYGRKFTVITDHEPLKYFRNTKKPDLRFNRLKAELGSYDFEIIYRSEPRKCNVDTLSRNPILQEGEENPDQPRVKFYELVEKQEKEDNYNEYDLPARILYITRSTIRHAKRNLGQNGAQMSGSGEARTREKDTPLGILKNSDEQEDSATDFDYREDSDTETRTLGPRRGRYRKKTEVGIGRRLPVCRKIPQGTGPNRNSVVVQAKKDIELAYLKKERNMRDGIHSASTPLASAARLPRERNR